MAINDWDAAVLCTDADCADEESRVLSWNGNQPLDDYRAQAKKKIGIRLKTMLRREKIGMDLDVDENILDHIHSYEPLRLAAVHLTIHMLCKDKTMGAGTLLDDKARNHHAFYNDAWDNAVDRLSLDVDESGDITVGEQYNVNRRVKLVRGL